jgi:hypothetical protein
MPDPSRQTKVFAVLLMSMSLCATVLLALGKNPPSAGAFCLDDYYQLESVAETVSSQAIQSPDRWNRIEIFFDGADSHDTSHGLLHGPLEPNYHFYICTGPTGIDGTICPTHKWNTQQPAANYDNSTQNEKTIRICIIAESNTTQPTNYQTTRLESLIAELTRRFDIPTQAINFPPLWQ